MFRLDPTKIEVSSLEGGTRSLDVVYLGKYEDECVVVTDELIPGGGRFAFFKASEDDTTMVVFAVASGRRLRQLWEELYAAARRSSREAGQSPLLVEYLLYLYFCGPAEVRFRVERLISLTRVRA